MMSPVCDAWVVVDKQFWAVPHDHETASPDQTGHDVVAVVVPEF
jgi:hypothetical protein